MFETIEASNENGLMRVTLNRVERRNSISEQLLQDLHAVLDEAERDPQCRVVVLQGKAGWFCTGMDFSEATQRDFAQDAQSVFASTAAEQHPFMGLLRRFSLIPRVIISLVDGRAMAGGIGLVAASDYVIAADNAEFSLSEALWGLLPAMVMPYLIRRVGFQPAYRMTLTTIPIDAKEAYRIHLADELAVRPEDSLRRLWLRLRRLQGQTILNCKQYFRRMWLIDSNMEQIAVDEITRLTADPQVQANIRNYTQYGKMPWES